VVADVVVEQVVADDADGDLFDPGWIVLQLPGVADLDLEQVVAGGRRLADDGDVVLREGMQQADAFPAIRRLTSVKNVIL